MKKLILSLMLVLLSHSLAFADSDEHDEHAEQCENLTEIFTPLGQLVIANLTTPPLEKLCRHIFKSDLYAKRGKEAKAIRQLEIIIRISTNQTPENISGPAGDLFIAEAQRLIGLFEVDNLGLPADPGAAGKLTLEGIDSDNDGVRDDLQRFIALTHTDSAKFRAYLTQIVKRMQESLVVAENQALSIALGHKDSLDSACGEYIDSVTVHSYQGRGKYPTLKLLAQVLNTKERSLAYIRHGEQLDGQLFEDPEFMDYDVTPLKQYCEFETDALPN